jgi:acylphosphatase
LGAVAVRRTVYFSGQVQGVGFRYTACRIAGGYDVTGFVRNLPDGRVHLVAEGESDEIDRFLEGIGSKMAGLIQGVQANDAPPTGQFADFGVAF